MGAPEPKISRADVSELDKGQPSRRPPEHTGCLAGRIRCTAMRKNSPCRFCLPNPWERQSPGSPERISASWTKGQPSRRPPELTGRLAGRVHCSAMRRNSRCRFCLPNTRERQSQCDAPCGIPSEDQRLRTARERTSAPPDCMTCPAHQAVVPLPGEPLGDPRLHLFCG
ncbi:UNVERIFIED_CONTAM: hypothetical protein FKN15_045011 [Acipenser sinensis]